MGMEISLLSTLHGPTTIHFAPTRRKHKVMMQVDMHRLSKSLVSRRVRWRQAWVQRIHPLYLAQAMVTSHRASPRHKRTI